MSQYWEKLGQLFDPGAGNRHPKLASHAANPLPVHLDGDVYRVFYSGRDGQNRSSVGAVDVDIVQRRILREHFEPCFVHGPEGSFYAAGVSIGNCYRANGRHYMLFMGWQAPPGGHWRGDIGRLIVGEDLSLELESETPFMGATGVDPVSLSYPWVMANPDCGFEMWYGSTLAWDAGNGEMLHVIQHASSRDGSEWLRHGQAIPSPLGIAQAFSRPTVLGNADGSREMWFSYRCGTGKTYRIGYAVQSAGGSWELDLAAAGIDVSASGWDSEMIEYPFAFEHKGQRYLLYNGNGHGRTGFGLAILRNPDPS
ncbi:MAG: hypothetical protein RIR00_743 [Pseudomonadota bacterium]|jgi:hypothetical protein